MGKTFDQIVTLIKAYYDNRSDMDDFIPDFINMAVKTLERETDWRHMDIKSTGTLTSSADSIAIPTRYKNTISFTISESSKIHRLGKYNYDDMISEYPSGSSSKAMPKIFATLESDSLIYVRPYPDKNYSYTFIYRAYTDDMSSGDTAGYWLETAWDVMLYGALLEAINAGFTATDADIALWGANYKYKKELLKQAYEMEKLEGSHSNSNPTTFVV